MKSRTIAIVGSIAALTFAAAPLSAVAATKHHNTKPPARVDRSRDLREVRHADKSPDAKSGADSRSADTSRDVRDS